MTKTISATMRKAPARHRKAKKSPLRRMRWWLASRFDGGFDTGGVLADDAGMSTAEYAIGTIAAAAFAAVLYVVVTGDSVTDGLTELVRRALSVSL